VEKMKEERGKRKEEMLVYLSAYSGNSITGDVG